MTGHEVNDALSHDAGHRGAKGSKACVFEHVAARVRAGLLAVEAGGTGTRKSRCWKHWIPACAGMTTRIERDSKHEAGTRDRRQRRYRWRDLHGVGA
jgi:hypothetical protein